MESTKPSPTTSLRFPDSMPANLDTTILAETINDEDKETESKQASRRESTTEEEEEEKTEKVTDGMIDESWGYRSW